MKIDEKNAIKEQIRKNNDSILKRARKIEQGLSTSQLLRKKKQSTVKYYNAYKGLLSALE